MPNKKIRVGIIGGGVAGLIAGYELSKAGGHVTLLERDGHLGGLAGSFLVEPDCEIEKYYHFICKPDKAYVDMMRELGISSHQRWAVTEMGVFYDGALHTIGDPVSLLAFPYLSIPDKVRFAGSTLIIKLANSTGWKALEDVPAQEWLVKWYGQRAYDLIYGPLLDLKFREYAPKISAAWMWARFHRLGNSRTITQQEHLGYLEGGTQVYIDALESALRERMVDLRTSAAVERLVIEEGRVIGIQCGGELLRFDCVLSTVPIPYMASLWGDVSGPYFDNLRQLEYIGVRVMVMRLRRKFCRYFWTNINDPEVDLAGIIEYTNLNPSPQLGGDAILYLPQYLSADHPLYEMSTKDLFDLYCRHLRKINPAFEPSWVKDYWDHRNRFAQPICSLGFSKRIPAMQTPIQGFYLTDSYQLHPYDRTISGSTELGIQAARLILAQQC